MSYFVDDDYFPGLKEVKTEIPEDAVFNGKGLVNTVASEWHKNRPESWVENVRNGVLSKQWKNNDARRESHSKKLSETWLKNYEHMAAQARKNGDHGLVGKDNPATLELEYKGKIYYGWADLRENTGVSKHLYYKYYKNGLDAENRIGKNGPVKGAKYKS